MLNRLMRIAQIIVLLCCFNYVYANEFSSYPEVMKLIQHHDQLLIDYDVNEIRKLISDDFVLEVRAKDGRVDRYNVLEFLEVVGFAKKLDSYKRFRRGEEIQIVSPGHFVYKSLVAEVIISQGSEKVHESSESYFILKSEDGMHIKKIVSVER